jgi:ribonucleoside-triphosphate reductase
MEQVSQDFSQTVTESRKGGVLESASKRVRMIFSVMASPNRIDILRILNTKGPLTYSELKALAGFKSKKESGKFAYHLRKLLRQLLVALNKGERRYTITNLGKLVLSLARQIEERSIIESGKMYVRTSRHSIEEFNSHKIIQSLVREAGLPLEYAHKITEEVENKIYKFQTTYLTSSLIRETVNSVLVEHGHEEYRNKLVRVGLPVADLSEMLSDEDAMRNGIDGIISRTAQSVFSEHLLFNTLPKDIADMHLAGDINISNSGLWGLIPDTIFLDVSEFGDDSLDFKGKFLGVSRLPAPKNSDDMAASLPILISLLSREASSEIVLDGVAQLLLKHAKDDELASKFARALIASSASPSYYLSSNVADLPITTIAITEGSVDIRSLNALVDGYRKYVEVTPVPKIALSLTYSNNGASKMKEHIEKVAMAVRSGGIISMSQGGLPRGLGGIRRGPAVGGAGSCMVLQSLSINLPRLAYESNKDETYFRAKLALMMKPALALMSIRKKAVIDYAKKGMVPVLSNAAEFTRKGSTSLAINLTGARESVYNILGHDSSNNGREVLQKVIRTAADVASAQGKLLGDDHVGVAMISDDSASRFAILDAEKYGKALLQSQPAAAPSSYSQGIILNGKDLITSTTADRAAMMQEYAAIDKLLNGGLSTNLDLADLSSSAEVKNAIEAALELPFFRPRLKAGVCTVCGRRSKTAAADRCEFCKSPHRLQVYS